LGEIAAIRGSCIVRRLLGLVLLAGLFARPASLFADVNPDGSFSYSIPIELPAGRNGIQPQLALVYNSNAGNGIVGVGWSIAIPAVSRTSSTGAGPAHFAGGDAYVGLNGKLIDASSQSGLPAGSRYQSQNQDWSIYEPHGRCGDAYCYWIVRTNDNRTLYFGNTSDSFVTAQDIDGAPINGVARLWALSKIEDGHGNTVEFSYQQREGQVYLTEIRYARSLRGLKHHVIDFRYEARPDVETTYFGGRVLTAWRLSEIVITTGQIDIWPLNIFTGDVVRRYALSYDQSLASGRSRLTTLTVRSESQIISELQFSYNGAFVISQDMLPERCTSNGLGVSLTSPGDFNGDGYEDIAAFTGSNHTWCISYGSASGFTSQSCMSAIGVGSDGSYVLDHNGDGFSDLAAYTGRNNTWCISRGSRSGLQPQFCTNGLGVSRVVVGDFNGDGLSDITSYTGSGHTWCTSYGAADGFTPQSCSSVLGVGPDVARAGDFNGDGYTDLAAFTGDGHAWCISPGSPSGLQPQYCTPNGVASALATAGDFNNDGFTDIAAYTGTSTTWCFAFGTRNGFMPEVCMPALGVDSNAALIGDYNGDGKLDMAAYTGNGHTWCIAYGNGYGVNPQICTSNGVATQAVAILDYNGDGYTDITAYTGINNAWCASRGQGYLDADRIVSVTKSGGTSEIISYSSSRQLSGIFDVSQNNAGQRAHNGLYFVVSQIIQLSNLDLDDDGLPDKKGQTFTYSGAKTKVTGDFNLRGSLGFEKIKTTDVNSGNYSITTYRQDKPFHGTPLSTRRYHANGTLIAEETAPPLAQYLCTEAGCSLDAANIAHPTLPRQFRQVGPRISKNFEDGALKLQKTEQVLAYDDYGNAQWIKVTEESRGYQRITYTFRKYINNVGSTRAIGLPYYEKTCLSETECTEGDANFVSAARFYYDNQPLGLNGQRNLLTRKEVYGPVENGFGWVAETFAYNRAGQIEDHRAANGIRTETLYDAEYSSYPASIFTSDGSHYKTTTHLYDPRFGKVRYSSDSETGINEQTDFDAAGRVREKTTRHLSTVIAKRSFYYSAYNAQPSWQRECVHFGSDFTEQRCTTKYHDAWGRVFREEFPEFVNGQYAQMAIERRYDARGREVKVSRPFSASHTGCAGTSTAGTNPAPCEWNVSTHDDYNRVISTTTFQAKTTTFEYPTDGLPSTAVTGIVTTGPDGKKKGEFKNILGKIATTYDAMHDLGRMTTVRYRYDALGRLVTVHAPTGDTVITYVGATSLQKSIFDPVAGLTEYQYYFTPGHPSYGKLRVEKQAGFVTTFEYDATFGRLSKSTKASTAAPDLPVETTHYIYDEPDKPNGKGRLTTLRHEKDGFTITERYSYDSLGEITETVRTVSHSSLSLCSDPHAIPCTQVYGRNKDNLGRVKEMLYPDGTKTQIEYADPFTTHVKRIRHDGTVYAEYDNYTYDVAPHVGTVRYHNGLTHEYSYYPDTGLLKSAKASNAAASLLHLEYDYDASYNIRNVEDKLVDRLSLYYEYDAHNRIQRASRRDGQVRIYRFDNPDAQDSSGKLLLKHNRRLHYPANKTFPTSDEVFDDTILDWKANQTFTWSASGNLIQKGPFTFTYDANGMMSSAVERPLVASPNSGGEEIAETKFYYDHAGQRFLKTHLRNGVMIKTWYLSDGIEFREKYVGVTNTSPGTFDAYQATKYIYGIDDKKLASITGSVKTTLPTTTSSTLFALADSYSSTSLAGLTNKLYYTFYGIYALENFSKTARIAGLSLAALLLFLYLYLTPRPSPKRRGEFPIWMRLTAATVLISFMSVNCGTGNAPGTTPGDLSGLGTPGDATTAAAPANTFISALYTGLPAGTVYYSHNHLGSGALVTDSAGNEVFRITYTEYGEIDLANSGKYNPATGEIEHHLDAALIAITAVKYTGQEYDPETGFYYYNARYYDPQLGVFTTPDTEFDKGQGAFAFNRHMYVGGNPIMYTDPTGHFIFALLAVAAIGATVGGVAAGTKGNIKGWLNGSQKFDWDAAWKGALAGGIGAVAGAGGAALGAAVFGTSTLAGSIATGAAAGLASGFAGGASGAWLNGASFGQGLLAGAIGGGIGALVGGAAGGISYGYDRYICNQVDEMLPPGNLPPEKKAAIEAFEREKYGDVVRPGASGYGRFIESNASNASWVMAKEAMKYTAGAGFLKGFVHGLIDRKSFGESFVEGLSQGAQWGMAAGVGTYALTTTLTLTAAGGGSGVITGFMKFSFKLSNPRIWLGAGVGLSASAANLSYVGLPFYYQPHSRKAYEN
jgi:RHS repeat-associated protein